MIINLWPNTALEPTPVTSVCFRFGLLLSFLAFVPVVARADFVIRQNTEYKSGFYLEHEHTTIRIQGDKARVDTVYSMTGTTNNGVAASMPGITSNYVTSLILDLRTGDSIMLLELYGQKWAVKKPVARAKQMAATAMTNSAGTVKTPPPQNSEKTSIVDGYQTEIYNWTNINGVSMKLWVARDFPNYKQITTQLEKLCGLVAPTNMSLDPTTLPGMVMKTETEGTNRVTTTLVSAKQEPVDASAFVIPNDYHVTDSQQPTH